MFYDVTDIMESFVGGNNDHAVIWLKRILSPGNMSLPIAEDTANQKVFLQIQLQKSLANERAVFHNRKFQSLCLIVQNVVQVFYVASHAVLQGTDILKDKIRSNIFRVNDTSNIQTVDNVIEIQAVDLGNQLGLGNRLGKKR